MDNKVGKIGIIGKRCNTLLSDHIADLPEAYIEPIEPKFDYNIKTKIQLDTLIKIINNEAVSKRSDQTEEV